MKFENLIINLSVELKMSKKEIEKEEEEETCHNEEKIKNSFK